ATAAEAAFLVHGVAGGRWVGARVELNAMDSQQLVDWLEAKLRAARVQKVVPDAETLAAAYRRAATLGRIRKAGEAIVVDTEPDRALAVPDDVPARLAERLKDSAAAWDTAVWELAQEDADAAT